MSPNPDNDDLDYDANGKPLPRVHELIADIPKDTDRSVRVILNEYPPGSGVLRLDLRVWQLINPNLETWAPTREGITLTADQLPRLEAALREAARRVDRLQLEPAVAA